MQIPVAKDRCNNSEAKRADSASHSVEDIKRLPHALFALKYLEKRHWLSEVVTIWDSIIFCTVQLIFTSFIYIINVCTTRGWRN